jgi:hypothetical protein
LQDSDSGAVQSGLAEPSAGQGNLARILIDGDDVELTFFGKSVGQAPIPASKIDAIALGDLSPLYDLTR